MENHCTNHPDRKALSFCHSCGEYYCDECLNEGKEFYYCKKDVCQAAFNTEKLLTKDLRVKTSKLTSSFSKVGFIIVGTILFALAILLFRQISRDIIKNSKQTNYDHNQIEAEVNEDNRIKDAEIKNEWIIQELPNTGLSLETPFKLSRGKVAIPSEYKRKVVQFIAYQYEAYQIQIMASCVLFDNNFEVDIEEAVEKEMLNVKAANGISSFTYKVNEINSDKISRRKIDGSFRYKNEDKELTGIFITETNRLWAIYCTYIKTDKNKVITNKIVNSVNINTSEINYIDYVTVKLQYGITLKIPSDWELFDEDRRILLQENVNKNIDFSNRTVKDSKILIAANFPSAPEATKMIMNIRYYGDSGISAEDVIKSTNTDIKDFDKQLKDGMVNMMEGSGLKIIKWLGTTKTTINNIPVLETKYKRRRNNDVPFMVTLLRYFSTKGLFTLTLSYKEDLSHQKRQDLDLIKESLNVK